MEARLRMIVATLLVAVGCTAAVAAGSSTSASGQRPLHVVMLGDSNTWLGGDACDQPKGWNKWFCDAFPAASCRSYARSGATWTHTDLTRPNPAEYSERLGDDNVVYNQVLRLVQDCDAGRQPQPALILISAGTNDVWFARQRPLALTATPADTASADPRLLTGAVRHDCRLLQQRFPEALIVLLTPMQSTAVADSLVSRAGDALADCARRLGLPCIRLDRESCVVSRHERAKRVFTYDGTHTSVAGARQNGRLIARRVAAMLGVQLTN